MKKIIATFVTLFGCFSLFGQSVVDIADSLLINAEFQKVISLIDKNLQAADDQTTLRLKNLKAEALIRSGKLSEAEALLKSLPQNRLTGITKTNLGALYLNQSRNDLAEEFLREALHFFDTENSSNTLQAAQAMNYLAQVYKFTGKHVQAEEQMQMALSVREKLLPPQHELIAASYNDLGLVYSQVDNDRALEYYEKARAIYENLHGSTHPKIAISDSNIGVVYRELGLYGDATNNFDAALKVWEKIYPQPHPAKAFVLYNLGETYAKIGNTEATKAYYERALDVYQKSYSDKHPDIARTLNALGKMASDRGDYNESITFFQRALQMNVRDFDSALEWDNPRLENYYHGNVLLHSLSSKAAVLEFRYENKTLKFSDLENSLRTLQSCDTLIDNLRKQISNEADKISLGVIANDVYAAGVRIATHAALEAFKKKPYLDLAFYFAEKSKSAVLLDAISDSDAKSFAGIPSALLEEETALKAAIALTAQQLSQKPSPEEEQYLRQTAFSLHRTYERFIQKLETDFPPYFNLKYNASTPSISQVQALLDDKTCLLSYFIDDNERTKRLYIFQITKNSYRVMDHAITDDFEKNITGLRNALYFNVMDVYTAASEALTRMLIPKIPKHVKELVILPTGRLGILPFETLFSKKATEKSYQLLPYLLREYAVRYEFSAGLMLQKSKTGSVKKPSILLCAPVQFSDDQRLADLPATETEVNVIANLFAEKKIANAVFTHQQATEHQIKTSPLKNYSYLHFATHGVVDEYNPQLSRIFLQRHSGAEDGNLYSGEIYNLELDAELVTLSACQTGLGKISKGEGVIGLSRALVYAGAKNIIVSYWPVADASTAELMKTFYARMLEDDHPDFHEDLRMAKLSMLENPEYATPYYWAPFILIGY